MEEEQTASKEGNEKLKALLKNKYIILLIAVIIFAFAVRIYFFASYAQQPIWWDEAENVLLAKHWGKGTPSSGFAPHREIGYSVMLAPVFWLGLGEVGARFFMLLISLLTVYITFLIGKELYNKKVGLIAAFLMSVFYLHLFFTIRFVANIPDALFWPLLVLLFWKGFIKKSKKSRLYVYSLFAIAAFALSAYAIVGLLAIAFLVSLIINDRLAFLKNKNLWVGLAIAVLILLPFVSYSYINHGSLFPRLEATAKSTSEVASQGEWSWGNFLVFTQLFPMYLKWPLLLAFILGLGMILTNLILGFDLLLKRQEKELPKNLLLLLWIALPLFLFSYFMGRDPIAYAEPRYLLPIFPAVFIIIALGLLKIPNWASKHKKEVLIASYFLIAAVLSYGAYLQLGYASDLIKGKSTSYLQVKQSALWMKEHSLKSDIILTNSAPHTTYYAERETTGPGHTEEDFIKKVEELKPKFLVISIYERSPQWVYNWPENHPDILRLVQTYAIKQDGKDTPSVMIYEFLRHDLILPGI